MSYSSVSANDSSSGMRERPRCLTLARREVCGVTHRERPPIQRPARSLIIFSTPNPHHGQKKNVVKASFIRAAFLFLKQCFISFSRTNVHVIFFVWVQYHDRVSGLFCAKSIIYIILLHKKWFDNRTMYVKMTSPRIASMCRHFSPSSGHLARPNGRSFASGGKPLSRPPLSFVAQVLHEAPLSPGPRFFCSLPPAPLRCR